MRKLLAPVSLGLFLAYSVNAGPILLNCACTEAGPDVPEQPDTPNSAPVWSIPDRALTVGDACTYDLNAVNADADLDTRTYTLVSGALPDGCSISGGSIVGTTTQDGAFNFVLGANDGQNTILRDTFTTSAPLQFTSGAFTPAQTDSFSFSVSITPSAANINHVCGFGNVSATGYANLLYAFRLNTSGNFDARNNGAYTAVNTVGYSAGITYNVTGTINLEAKTYSIAVNGTAIATNYLPRGNATVASLGYFTCVDDSTPGVVGTTTGPLSLIQPVTAAVTWTVAPADDTTPPSAPAAPTVTGVTQTTVTLDLPTPEHHHDLYRSPAGCGAFALLAQDLPGGAYTDTGLTQNTAYCYRLIEFDAADNASTAGSTANATTSAVDVNALLSIADTSVAEGDASTTNLTFTLTASASQAFDIVCQYQTIAGSADSSTDYTAASGTVQIDSGNTTEDITVVVNGDTTVESDETVGMLISNCGQGGIAVNATTFSATGTITNDDDDDPVEGLELTCENEAEGDSGVSLITCTVEIAAQSGDVTFRYYTVNGTASAWSDYMAVSGLGVIREGQTTFEIEIPVVGDSTDESDETVTVRLADVEGLE